jgi:hypothetical protein
MGPYGYYPPPPRRGRFGRFVKWMIVLLGLAYWYGNGGREFLFGDDDGDDFGIPEDGSFEAWVNMPPEWDGEHFEVQPILNDDGEVVGEALAARMDEEATDPAGHPRPRWQVRVQADRSKLGYPIHVAVSDLQRFTFTTLA